MLKALCARAAAMTWCIEPVWLEQILAIANREGPGPEAVSAQLGRPLQNTQKTEMRDGVAVIPVVGPIFRRANMLTEVSGATSLEILARDFTAALYDKSVKSIVLNIDSPGGEANGINEFADMIHAARGTKPVVAYIGGTGASAAYWIASAADSIVADATAQVGSIGVVAAVPNPAAQKSEQIEIVSSQSPSKRVDVSTKDGRATIQATVDALADVFIDTVARNRGVTSKVVTSNYGRGGVLVGADAVKAGLVDSIGSFEGTLMALRDAARGPKGKTMNSTATSLALIFGLSADASAEAIAAAATDAATAAADRKRLLAAAGADDVMTALGVIDSAKVAAAKVPDLEKTVKEQGERLDAQAKSDLLAKLRGESKLTAHMDALAGEMTLEQLEKFAAKAAVVPHLSATVPAEKAETNTVIALLHNGKAFESLTSGERHTLYTENHDLFAAMKADAERRGVA